MGCVSSKVNVERNESIDGSPLPFNTSKINNESLLTIDYKVKANQVMPTETSKSDTYI